MSNATERMHEIDAEWLVGDLSIEDYQYWLHVCLIGCTVHSREQEDALESFVNTAEMIQFGAGQENWPQAIHQLNLDVIAYLEEHDLHWPPPPER